MVMSFKEAFTGAVKNSGDSLGKIAQATGVPESHLSAVLESSDPQINVDDAQKIAAYFGLGLDAFLGDPDMKGPIEIVALYNQLPGHLKRQFLVYGRELPESEDHSDPE